MSKPKLIPLSTEEDLQKALGFSYKMITLQKISSRVHPPMSLKKFQKRRKANRLARHNRKQNVRNHG